MKTMLEQSKEIRSAGARLAGVATKEYKGFKIVIHSRTVKEGANIPTASYFAEVPELDWSSKYFKTTAEAAKDAMKLIDESARDVGLSAGSRLAGEKWGPWKRAKDDEHFRPIIIQKFFHKNFSHSLRFSFFLKS